jgi:hypothetical protein
MNWSVTAINEMSVMLSWSRSIKRSSTSSGPSNVGSRNWYPVRASWSIAPSIMSSVYAIGRLQ